MKGLYLYLYLFSLFLYGEGLPVKSAGQLDGILTAKGDAWVEVKEDKGLTDRYLAKWEGGSPVRGGGFDQNSLALFKTLVVGNRVRLEWFWDGHLRVATIKSLKPFKKSGIFNGTLIKKGDKWIDVENQDTLTPWRFYVRWVGGLPEAGGGYHSKTLKFFDNFEESDLIRFAWSYDYRPRIEHFIKEKEEIIPFYEGKSLAVPQKMPQPVRPSSNPFDQVPSTNPFDQVVPTPSTNPFDQVAPKSGTINPFEQLAEPAMTNPFDSAPPTSGNPFDQSAGNSSMKAGEKKNDNPFDSVPAPKEKEVNPFENVPLPGNPFDAVEQ